MRLLLISLLLGVLTGCSANMIKQWDDDYNNIYGFKGGVFNYLHAGAPFVWQARYNEGVNRVKEICGERPYSIMRLGSKESTSTMVIPTFGTTNYYGSFYSGENSGSFNGTSYTAGMTTIPVSSRYFYIRYLCQDIDTTIKIYQIASLENRAPVCKSVEAPFIPGKYRIENVAKSAETEDCSENEGWMRILSPDGQSKGHIFVGDKGKALCKALEDELIEKQIISSNVNLYLRKRLSCR